MSSLVTEKNRGLKNYFTGKEANHAQQSDLLNFRFLGQQEFLQRISSMILKTPSVRAPNRRRPSAKEGNKIKAYTTRKR